MRRLALVATILGAKLRQVNALRARQLQCARPIDSEEVPNSGPREHLQLSNRIQSDVQLRNLKSALVRMYADVESNHTLQLAAALSYYFVMALFPGLILLSATGAFLPVPVSLTRRLT